jgi:nucleotide-binding universal stress UspA family protein
MRPAEMKLNSEIQNILVPTDFSEGADNALEMAAQMAERHNANVFLIHIYVPAIVVTGGGTQAIVTIDKNEDAVNYNKLLLHQKEQLRDEHPHVNVDLILQQGHFVDSVNEIIKEKQIDLVIMGTEAKLNLKKFILGSCTYDAIVHGNCSVLTVPVSHKKYGFQKILFPLRNVEDLEAKLTLSLNLLQKNRAFINVLGLTDVENAAAFQTLAASVVKPLLVYRGSYDVNLVLTDENAVTICEFSKQNQNDLIVLSNTDEHSWKSFIAGNFFKKIINATDIPLLFVKPKTEAEKAEEVPAVPENFTRPVPG